MTLLRIVASLLCSAAPLAAQLAPGTAIPIMISSTLDAKNARPGEKFGGRIMQDILLPDHGRIKAGGHVVAHIVEVKKSRGSGSRLVLVFDTLQAHEAIPVTLALRAVASTQSTYQAQIPIDPTSDSESSQEWVMQQVGGDTVFRGQSKVTSNGEVVGRYNGAVIGRLRPAADLGCPDSDDNGVPQALWIFSTAACGVYGLEDVKLVQNGRTAPVGQIVFESPKNVYIHGGSGWLLVVVNSAAAVK